MGEAKRRKKLDPNFGQTKTEDLIAGLTASQWREKFGFSLSQWSKIQPYFRVVPTPAAIDRSVDGVWLYYQQDGKEGIFFTGQFYEIDFLMSLPSQVSEFYSDEVEKLIEDAMNWDDTVSIDN